MPFSEVDFSQSPPRVTFPREYNAAVDLIDRNVAEGRGSRIAIIDDRGKYDYADLLARTNRAGNALKALGVLPEQRVLLLMLDTVDFVAAFLGAMKIGAVPIPVNTLLTADDYAYITKDCRARVAIVSDYLLPKLEAALAKSQCEVRIVVSSTTLGGDAGTHLQFDALMAEAASELAPAPTTPDDVAFWLYSSGSTGAPKGALHLHAHLMRTAALYARGVLGIRQNDIVYSAAKLFFAYGLGNALTFPFSVGATAVLTAERVTSSVVTKIMTTHEPTLFCGVPTLFASLLANDSFAASPKLRASISAGEALPKHVGSAWREKVGTDILDGIGSTEMLHIFLSNRHGDVRYGTSGKAVPGYELKIVDDQGNHVPDGEEGSLWVRGETSCVAYWNQRERSLATFQGPWTKTGDRYIRDADGYYTYSGRADDMLKVGGIWVSPFEVESALASHAAVLEAAVVGHADDQGLIKPKAYVVLKNGDSAPATIESELKAFVKEKLAPYKYPRWIEFVSELPKTATGKIQRFRLRGG
ncbi:MAG: benzoate-CoA ligase family protein [Polyangiaceae bacterium]